MPPKFYILDKDGDRVGLGDTPEEALKYANGEMYDEDYSRYYLYERGREVVHSGFRFKDD